MVDLGWQLAILSVCVFLASREAFSSGVRVGRMQIETERLEAEIKASEPPARKRACHLRRVK